MTGSLSGHIYQLAAAIWRRRKLIIVPLLVSIPLSVLAASLAPKKYVATTLLLLQEGGRENPLSSTVGHGDGLNERMAGLEALLKSEYILMPALELIMGDEFPTSPRMQALELQSLKDALSIELIGKSFMRLSLRGAKPEHMGDALSAITTSFMDSLLMASQGPPVVTQFLLDQHKARMEAARKALQDFRVENGDAAPSTVPPNEPERLETLARDLATARAEVERAEAQVAISASEIGERSLSLPLLEADMAKASAALDKVVAAPESASQADDLRKYLAQLRKAADRVRARDALLAKVGKLSGEHGTMMAEIEGRTSQIRKAAQLERNLVETTQHYQNFAERYANADAAARRALKVLDSPESVRVIDPPKDPELGLMSRVVYVIAGILAGLGVGCSGAVVAEALDRRLRQPEEFREILGAPIVCHLPGFGASEREADAEVEVLPSNIAQLPRIERSTEDMPAPRVSG